MAPLKGMDVAWARPTIAEIKATGAHWVARYFSLDASKNLTAAEVRDYVAAGLSVVTVYESTAARALQGRAAGVADAVLAERQRVAVGLPITHVQHFAVDSDVSWASVQAYFDGAASVVGLDRVGCYGGLRVINGAQAYGIRYLWQTVAWSGGVWSPHATIRQPGGTLLGGGADVDYAEVPDFGQYPRPSTPQEPDMPLSQADANLVAHAVAAYKNVTASPPEAVDLHQHILNAETAAASALAQVKALSTQLAGLSAAVQSLASHLGSDDAEVATIVAAVQAAIKDAVIHVEVGTVPPAP